MSDVPPPPPRIFEAADNNLFGVANLLSPTTVSREAHDCRFINLTPPGDIDSAIIATRRECLSRNEGHLCPDLYHPPINHLFDVFKTVQTARIFSRRAIDRRAGRVLVISQISPSRDFWAAFDPRATIASEC